MRKTPLLTHRVAGWLRSGVSLSLSGLEVEPQGGYSRKGLNLAHSVIVRAPAFRLGVREAVRASPGVSLVPIQPSIGPIFPLFHLHGRNRGESDPCLPHEFGRAHLRHGSWHPWVRSPFGWAYRQGRTAWVEPTSHSRVCPGPRPRGGGFPFASNRPVRPWVSWGPKPPWPSWVHSWSTTIPRPSFVGLVQPWVSWGLMPPWPSWVHSVGPMALILVTALVATVHWAFWTRRLPRGCWGLPSCTACALFTQKSGTVQPWVSWGPWPPWPSGCTR